MEFIDAHAHIFERLNGFGSRGELRPIGNGRGRWATGEEIQIIPPKYGDKEFLPERLIQLMDENNVRKGVLLQGCLYGFQNEFVHETVKKYPDRFIGAGTLDPFCISRNEIMNNLIDKMGYKILKFEISSTGGLMGYHKHLKLDSIEMEEIWQKASIHNIVIVLDLGSCDSPSFQINNLIKIINKYRTLKIVIAHLLAPSINCKNIWLDALVKLNKENVWFDIAALPWLISCDKYPFPISASFLKEAKNIIGADRMLWGSDCPILLTIATYKQLLEYIIESKVFSMSEMEKIFYKNAVNVFNI